MRRQLSVPPFDRDGQHVIKTMRSGYFNMRPSQRALIDGWYQTGDQSPLTETGRL
jgi:long-subunit acyl-CoA synthetase (AMP-forming)